MQLLRSSANWARCMIPNPQDNTVDLHWTLVQKGSSQVQLQAGYGGNSFIGTLSIDFQ